MKNVIYLLVIVTLFSCYEGKKDISKKIDITLEKEIIDNVLDNWHKSAAEANYKTYFDAMTSEGIFIGTDASENWTITKFKKFSKPYFDKGKAWSFTAVERNIYVHSEGKVAWFDELLDTHMGVCRGSGVLSKKDSLWKIKHYVLSLTIPNDNIDKVKKINKEKDSIFLTSLKK
jgi:hypothetical protein